MQILTLETEPKDSASASGRKSYPIVSYCRQEIRRCVESKRPTLSQEQPAGPSAAPAPTRAACQGVSGNRDPHAQGPVGLTGDRHQTFREEIISMYKNSFRKQTRGHFQIHSTRSLHPNAKGKRRHHRKREPHADVLRELRSCPSPQEKISKSESSV